MAYLRDISKYKILDASEVSNLVTLAQQGDEIAKDKVVKSNLRFVVTIAKQYQNRGIPLMDLIAEGNAGILKALDKYDPTKGVPFLSYAVWWIKQCIYTAIYWHGKEIRLPLSQQLLVNDIVKTIEEFTKKHQRQPSAIEISELTGIAVDKIDYLSQFASKLVSIDDFIHGDEDNSQICDIIPDKSPLLDEIIDNEFFKVELKKILEKLTVREHDIICMYFGIGVPKIDTKIIASMFGIVVERVRQLKESALEKLRTKLCKELKTII